MGGTGSCSDGQGHAQQSLNQFSIDGRGCVPSLLFDLRPNYGGGNEDNGNLLQKVPCTFCYTQCPQPCSRLPANHASARDFWALVESLSLVGSLLLSPGSWCAQGSVCVLLPVVMYECESWTIKKAES